MKCVLVILLTIFSHIVLAQSEKITTESTNTSTNTSISETTVKSPPPTAISPGITVINNDLCVVGVAVQLFVT